jgi:two-component system, cell cycle response regulator
MSRPGRPTCGAACGPAHDRDREPSIALPPEWRVTDQSPIATTPAIDAGRALLVFDSAQIATCVPLDPGTLIAGRSSRCEIWLQDPGVSRRHCQLRSEARSTWLKDLDSTNGTTVNGRRIETRELQLGDVIGVGGATLTLVRRDSPECSAHRALTDLAYRDDLSGLLNPRGFRLQVDAAFALRHADQRLALLVMDADHFKAINDRYGHAMGDRVIRQIANCVRASLPAAGFAGRIGGEEFAIVLPQAHIDGAGGLAEQLRQRIVATPLKSRAGPVAVTVSIGLAIGDVAAGARDLFARADAALYRAKALGRNRVCE